LPRRFLEQAGQEFVLFAGKKWLIVGGEVNQFIEHYRTDEV
jgi:hypothetical protein